MKALQMQGSDLLTDQAEQTLFLANFYSLKTKLLLEGWLGHCNVSTGWAFCLIWGQTAGW